MPNPLAECSSPLIGAPSEALYVLWQVVYWSSQVLTWLLLPMMQSYATAGEFTVMGRIKTALISNGLFYASYLVLAIVFLIVLVSKGVAINKESLYSIVTTASNTWGLFCLVFLLGYGLVEVPRVCWRRGDVRLLLRESYFKIAKLSLERSDAEDELQQIGEAVKRAANTIGERSEFTPHINEMLQKLPESISSRLNRRNLGRAGDDETEYFTDFSMKSLAKVHKKLIGALHRHQMAEARWQAAVARSLRYEDTVNSIASTGFYHRTTGAYSGFFKVICSPTVEWYWRCLFQPWLFRGLACILAVLSLFVVWSECVFWCQSPVLSLYAIFIDEAQKNHAFFVLECLSAFTVAYLSVCAYYTIFKVRILSYYHLSPHHNTDDNSLTFSGMLLCRFTPALCLNYLSLIHLEKSVNPTMVAETAYSRVMGRMQLLKFISQGFNIYFPMAIIVLCLCTLFSVGSRILHALGFQQFIGEDDMTNELVEEGRQLISRERGYLDRAARREERRKELEDLGVINGQSTSTAGDLSARQRRQYQPPSDAPINDDIDVVAGTGMPTTNNDRSQLLTIDLPSYTDDGRSNNQAFPGISRPNPGGNSRNLFDDI